MKIQLVWIIIPCQSYLNMNLSLELLTVFSDLRWWRTSQMEAFGLQVSLGLPAFAYIFVWHDWKKLFQVHSLQLQQVQQTLRTICHLAVRIWKLPAWWRHY